LFLKKVSGTLGRYKHRRIVGKTSFFRMDLLKAKFASLGRAARAEFDDGAADAMEAARASRLQALQGFRSRRAFAPAAAGSFSADSQVRATAASQQQSSIASAAAACSPGPLECPTAFYPEGSLAERPAAAAKATALAIDAHTGQRPAVAAALGSASVPGMPQVHGDAGGGTDPHPPALEAVAMWLRVDVPAVLPPSPAESPEAVAESGADASACPVIETDPGSSVQKKFEPDSGVLGAGVFGACRAVREVSSGERLCAKFALVRSVGDLARSNLRAEFAAMSRLNHPAVMQAFSLAFDSAGGLQAMLMPLMSSSLWAWLVAQLVPGAPVAAGQGLPLNSKSCLLQLASGLGHCHGRSIHHLDIKPENVLVDTSMDPPRFALSDFGNCEAVDVVDGLRCSGKVPASRVNSPEYRPFELFRCYDSLVAVRPRFDIWSFGCLVFDVANVHPRQRGRAPRMMTGAALDGGNVHSLTLARNGRVAQYARVCVRPLILALQPGSARAASQVSVVALYGMLRSLPVA